jgi:cytochrome c5
MLMHTASGTRRSASAMSAARTLITATAALLGTVFAGDAAIGQPVERTGKAVVDAVCRDCHATGKDGAPRIGDAKAWGNRTAQGLGALTLNAINGIRRMPAHGGSTAVSDTEIARAIAYMVNQSGGQWIEPTNLAAPAVTRTGEQVAQTRCADCHLTGDKGAPRIGDRAAWTPRLSGGLDRAVRSAIHGHGGMPARGGMAELTDVELRSAIVYMFNPLSVSTGEPAPAPNAPIGPRHKAVGGIDIHLGMIAADVIRRQLADDPKRLSQAGVPGDRDAYHVSVSLFDAATHVPITNAQVEATIKDPVMGGQTRKLDMTVVNGVFGYGNYFRVGGTTPYRVALHIVRGDTGQMVDTDFEVRR